MQKDETHHVFSDLTINTARALPWHDKNLNEDYEAALKMDPAVRKSLFPGVPPFINYVPIGGVTGEVVRYSRVQNST